MHFVYESVDLGNTLPDVITFHKERTNKTDVLSWQK